MQEQNKIPNDTILDTVKSLIYNDRSKQYGSIEDNMKTTSNLFYELTGKQLSERECILFMVCHKLARETFKEKDDNIIDAIGYLGLYYDYVYKNED